MALQSHQENCNGCLNEYCDGWVKLAKFRLKKCCAENALPSNLYHCMINPVLETIVELAKFVTTGEQAAHGTTLIRFRRVF